MLGDLLTPWFVLAAILIPLINAERWIHSHLYGVGWLLTKDNHTATILYYLFLFPGVFLHEVVQWLIAGALNIKTKRLTAWPEAQEDGTLRLDFVQVEHANWLSAAVIGAAPLIVGLLVVMFISNNILNLEDFLTALSTGDFTIIGPALRDLGSTPDFYIWLYIMFAVGNAMLPTPSDRRGWPLLLAIFAGIVVFLAIIGTGEVLLATFTGPVAHTVDLMATAFGTVLAVELWAIITIGFFEEILERTTKRKFVYQQEDETTSRASRRRPGESEYLAPGEPRPSIYNLELPLPDPSEAEEIIAWRQRLAAPSQTTPATLSPRQIPPPSALQSHTGRPAEPATSTTREKRDAPLGSRPAPPGTAPSTSKPAYASSTSPAPSQGQQRPGHALPSTSPDRPTQRSPLGMPSERDQPSDEKIPPGAHPARGDRAPVSTSPGRIPSSSREPLQRSPKQPDSAERPPRSPFSTPRKRSSAPNSSPTTPTPDASRTTLASPVEGPPPAKNESPVAPSSSTRQLNEPKKRPSADDEPHRIPRFEQRDPARNPSPFARPTSKPFDHESGERSKLDNPFDDPETEDDADFEDLEYVDFDDL